MRDIRVDIKVRNNRILVAIEKAGYKSVAAFCRENGIDGYQQVNDLIGMRSSPISFRLPPRGSTKHDWNRPLLSQWTPITLRLADALNCDPSDLFSQSIVEMEPLKRNTAYLATTSEKVRGWLTERAEDRIENPEQKLLATELCETIAEKLTTLTPREEMVIKMRFGMGEYDAHTLEEAGRALNVTRMRIRQIESKALRKMRHPARALPVKKYLARGV